MLSMFHRKASVSVREVESLVSAKDIGFIDVRSIAEFQSGHAKGARNYPLDTLSHHIDALKNYREVYVICLSGGRSMVAVQSLNVSGVKAINVPGGTMAWRGAGLAME